MVMTYNPAHLLRFLNYMTRSYLQTTNTRLIIRKRSKLMQQILKTTAGLILLQYENGIPLNSQLILPIM